MQILQKTKNLKRKRTIEVRLQGLENKTRIIHQEITKKEKIKHEKQKRM